ncbi:single-stranded DNA-binding protein [Fructobacillus tropaeoli]|uniref:Single-stranded DNA-binding protein n=1 Tax=Fructobacillus tropaeoli TaxID=709323 RepID=A0A3F3H633_9LACO|nr:single-stranded DNA-binding protein [Fructobacillus tropaeoli]GAP05012.1 single-strand binding protein [Fructobacillus tropaeoli]
MINRVVLIGRMTKDVELRYTQSGTAVGSFTLAVNRSFKNSDGEREADFINAVIWRKAAENLANFTGKGAMVAIEGRLQTRNYENNQGQRVYVTEVVVDNFSLLESKAESDKRRAENGTSQPAQQSPAPANNGGIDISDDDLPF